MDEIEKNKKMDETDDLIVDSSDEEIVVPEEELEEESELDSIDEDTKSGTSSDSKDDEVKSELPREKTISHIYVVKVTTNKEDKALDMVADKIKKKNINVYSIARPHGLRGYILLEAPDRDNAEEAVFNLPYVKGIIPKIISYEEVKPMLEPITADIKIEKNDIIEIISEPFKKEKAKVVRIDKTKGEAVVSLLGATVPIPVTVKLDNIRVIRREEGGELED